LVISDNKINRLPKFVIFINQL